MSAAKFKVGDRVRRDADTPVRTVVLPEPDSLGRIVVTDEDGAYIAYRQDEYELAPQRYVVEIRPPKKGERYAFHNETIVADYDYDTARPVIVDEDGA